MASPQRASSTASSIASRAASQPTTVRRGVPGAAGADQRLDLDQQRARALEAGEHRSARDAGLALGEEQRRRVRHRHQAALGHLEHADLVGRAEAVLDRAQDAELVAAVALEVEHRVDHVLEHAGPGDLAVLGDVADQEQGRAAALGEADQLVRAAAQLGDRAGRRLDAVDVHGLDRIDDQQARRAQMVEGRQDVAHRGRGGDLERRLGAAEAGGAQADLVDRFLAADVGDLGAGGGERGAGLEHERRLADAGIAADQHRRALDQAAAQHPVELGIGARQAGRRLGRALELEQLQALRAAAAAGRRPFGTGLGALSSASVFHSPQASQRPAHFGCTAPQLWQTYWWSDRAMLALAGTRRYA